MFLLGLLACAHTPPHGPVPGEVRVESGFREDFRPDRKRCRWEGEALRYEDRTLLGELPDTSEGGCPEDRSLFLDQEGQDGPFVSLIVREQQDGKPLPARCVTLDLRTGAPTSLRVYDPKLADKRLLRAQKVLARAGVAAVPREEDFLVGGKRRGDGHVRLCVQGPPEGPDPRTIPVR
jgi:hypothetical protein